MKIAVVSERAGDRPIGHVADLSAALARADHDVTVYTRRDHADVPRVVVDDAGYRIVHLSVGPSTSIADRQFLYYMGEFGRALVQEWTDEQPDVVHAHYWKTGIAAQLAARSVAVPMVQTFHSLGGRARGLDPSDSNPERAQFERLIARDADRVIATTTGAVADLARMGVPRSRTRVVPYGVDLGSFDILGASAERTRPHRIVAIGSMLSHNGFDAVIAACALLADTELVIVGRPGERAEANRLLSAARIQGVDDRVDISLRASRDELAGLVRSADVVVCLPGQDTFGGGALEAMACAKPVVAREGDGFDDVVVDGVTGWLVSGDSPTALAHTLRTALSETHLSTAAGLCGRDRVQSRYTWSRVADDTARVYDEVVLSDDTEDSADPAGNSDLTESMVSASDASLSGR